MDIECNTLSLDAKQRTELWCETVRSVYGSIDVVFEQHGENLSGHLKSTGRNMLRFNTLRYCGQSHIRTPADIGRLKNEYVSLTRPRLGKVDINYGGTQDVFEPSKIYLFNHAVPYFAKPHGEYEVSGIAFPASALRQRGVKLQPMHALSTSSHQGILISAMADQLASSYSQWSDQEFSFLTEQLIDLIAFFFFAPGSAQSSEESSVRSAHLQRACAFINTNFGDSDLSPARIAQACGISLSYLNKLFRASGTSVEATVISERLERSKMLLMSRQNKHHSIGMIAYMSGFINQAHFSRAFRQRFSCTPRELRHSKPDELENKIIDAR